MHIEMRDYGHLAKTRILTEYGRVEEMLEYAEDLAIAVIISAVIPRHLHMISIDAVDCLNFAR